MDFALMSLDSFVGPAETLPGAPSSSAAKPKPKSKLGSGFLKKERSGPERVDEDDEENNNCNDGGDNSSWRPSKVAKTMASRSGSLFHSGEAPAARQKQEQMVISFGSDSKSEVCFVGKDGGDGSAQSLAFPYCQRNMASSYNPRTTGYGSGRLNEAMHVGLRGAFTASQWIELEHQALIYKYITSNVAVPSNLLLPIKKSLNPFAFSASSPLISSFPANSFGWGGFQVGLGENSDPEPGRCRRTDGKKWRCSRDAVVDQKYCERHINRGRHRSRKPVEPSPTTTTTNPIPASPAGAIDPNPFTPAPPPPPPPAPPNRMSSSAEAMFVVPKQEPNLNPVFGLVSTDSLLNPSHGGAYGSPFLDQPLRHFTDDWPKAEPSRAAIAWQEEAKPAEWTRLSMSIPRLSLDLGPKQPPGWAPVPWGPIGGPLGEVLTNTSQRCGEPSEGWDSSPRVGSSPTGVLHKSALSNSSSGSSPRPENNNKSTSSAPSL